MKKLFYILSFLLSTSAFSQTQVSGGIYSNTTWTLANSPYIMTGPVVVFPGNTLTIQPGVVVMVQDKGSNTGLMPYLELRGSLVANGTASQPIRFIAEVPTENYIWKGIEIKTNQGATFTASHFELSNSMYGISSDKIYYDTLRFNHFKFRHNNYALMLAGALVFDNCTFTKNGAGAPAMPSFGSVTANNCVFDSNGVAFTTISYGVFITNSQFKNGRAGIMASSGVIESCTFLNNEIGLDNCFGIIVRNSIFQQNDIGISGANESKIENNFFIANGLGIEMAGPSMVLNNDINANQIGVTLNGNFEPGGVVMAFNDNRICSNGLYNIENKSDLNLGLEKNCFCSQDSATIEASIFDGYDDFTRGLINFATYDTSCVTLLKTIKKVNLGTGTKEIANKNFFLVYPNPANDKIIIEAKPNQHIGGSFRIIDALGNTVLDVEANSINNSLEVNINELKTGIYFITHSDYEWKKVLIKL